MSKTYHLEPWSGGSGLRLICSVGEKVTLLAAQREGTWLLWPNCPSYVNKHLGREEIRNITKEEAVMILFQCKDRHELSPH